MLAAALLSTAVLAAVETNQYIWKTTVSIGVDDYGVVTVASGVTATDIYPDVGIERVEIYRVGKTSPEGTYSYTSRPSLMAHNTVSHTATVTHNGSPGASYYAKVSFYAGQMGVAGGSHTTNSAIVP